jgi:NADH-quinone oxidoreductase subunit N
MFFSLSSPFLPDLLLLALAMAVLASDLWDEEGKAAFHLAWIGLTGIGALLALQPVQPGITSFADYWANPGIQTWKLLFAAATLGAVFLSRPYFSVAGNARGAMAKAGAFYGLLLLCAQGMFALVSASNLILFYLGLELATLPVYALAAFQTRGRWRPRPNTC